MSDDEELNKIVEYFGIDDAYLIDDAKETAMNRFNVKKSKRPAIKRILDESFNILNGKSLLKGTAQSNNLAQAVDLLKQSQLKLCDGHTIDTVDDDTRKLLGQIGDLLTTLDIPPSQ
jgi:hypothetical protein